MERRRVQRVKRRLPCEFLHEGNRHRGIVVDLSSTGLFLQTDTALGPGAEIEVHLSGQRFPDLTLRAVVARRRFTPAVLATMIRRGVGLRLLEPPPEYVEALRRLGSEGSDEPREDASAEDVVEIEIPEPTLTPEEIWGELPLEPEPEPQPEPAPEPVPTAQGDLDDLQGEQAPEERPTAEPEGWIFEPEFPTDVLMIDDGELDDVHALLVELGASLVRERQADPAAFRGWSLPPRLLVVGAGHAARLRVPNQAAADRVATVAVAEADSHTLRSMLRRQGFQFVVRRPVHPEALRLLLLRALHREDERRSVVRLAFGYEVSWRSGWSRRRGMLCEISSAGCRILCPDAPDPGDRVTVRIPREVADGSALSLAGRVLRSETRLEGGDDARYAFAVRFEDLSERARERLAVILQERSLGPATLPGRARQERPKPRRPARLQLKASPPSEADPAARGERRGSGRGALGQEVVALDLHEERVKHVLFGRDLSIGGMRVEPHPELALGDRVRLALYEASSSEALLLEATAQRDDRDRGMVLRFEDLSAGARDRLERMLAVLPSVEGPGAEGEPPKPLIVSEIVSE
jgi:hypothetical protein